MLVAGFDESCYLSGGRHNQIGGSTRSETSSLNRLIINRVSDSERQVSPRGRDGAQTMPLGNRFRDQASGFKLDRMRIKSRERKSVGHHLRDCIIASRHLLTEHCPVFVERHIRSSIERLSSLLFGERLKPFRRHTVFLGLMRAFSKSHAR